MRRKDREITAVSEITEILDTCKTACIAMIDHNVPYIVPLSYGYELKENRLTLFFHCAKEGRKLDILRRDHNVCFTIFNEGELLRAEIPCNSGYSFSSIIGNGTVEWIEDSGEKREALKKIVAHQTGRDAEFTDGQSDLVCVFQIISTDYTAKRKAGKK